MTALVVKAGDDGFITRLQAANELLASAVTLPQLNAVADLAAAAELWARRQKLSDEAIGHAHRLNLVALRRMGEILLRAPKASGTRGQLHGRTVSGGSAVEPPEDSTPTLHDHGLDKKKSMVAQRLAKLPLRRVRSACSALRRPGGGYPGRTACETRLAAATACTVAARWLHSAAKFGPWRRRRAEATPTHPPAANPHRCLLCGRR